MNEQLNFRQINTEECNLIDQQFNRDKVNINLATQPYTGVYVEYSRQGNLTIATIYCDRNLYIGAAKRMVKDSFIDSVGKNIAFCRALNGEPISLP